MKTYTISPSDLTFLWKSKRCFYLKYALNIQRPRMPFPQIFNEIDALMKAEFKDKNLNDLHPSLPKAKVLDLSEWVESVPFAVPEYDMQIVIRGKVDTVIQFEDNTYGIVDNKTAKVDKLEDYKLAMNAYAFATEHSAEKEKYGKKDLSISPISKLGLIVYEPNLFTLEQEGNLKGSIHWVEIEKNTDAFLKFLGKRVAPLLAQKEVPAPEENDEWYKYVENFYVSTEE